MNFEANNETTIYKEGLTSDIIAAVKIAFDNNVDDCAEVAENFRGKNIIDTSKNIWQFLCSNIKYKVDPDGKQLIRTPARLWKDRTGDCKSYSLFACCMLSCLGIKNKFRFVDYGSGDFTHVYTVAYDENDKEIIIDAVASQCQHVNFNNELYYKKKKDMKNRAKTEIAFLSGLAQDYGEEAELNVKAKANSNYIASLIYLAAGYDSLGIKNEITKEYGLYEFIQKIVLRTYAKDVPMLQVCGYVIASNLDKLTQNFDEMNDSRYNYDSVANDVVQEIKKYLSNSNEKGEYVLTAEFKNANADFISWWNKYIIGLNYNSTDTKLPYRNSEISNELDKNCLAFLYCVCSTDLLNNKAKKKKELQLSVLKQYIAGSTITEETALNFIAGAIMFNFNSSPDDIVKVLKTTKKTRYGVGAVSVNDVTGWISSLSNSFSTIFGAIKGNNSSTSNTNPTVIYPSTSDFSSSSNMLIYGLLGLGAILILYRNKSKK